MQIFENTPILTAKDILSKAKILGAEAKLRDLELNIIGAEYEAKKVLMHMIGRHIGEQLQEFQLDFIQERDFPEEFTRRYRAEVVVLTKEEYNTLVSVIDTLDRKEQFERSVQGRIL